MTIDIEITYETETIAHELLVEYDIVPDEEHHHPDTGQVLWRESGGVEIVRIKKHYKGRYRTLDLNKMDDVTFEAIQEIVEEETCE